MRNYEFVILWKAEADVCINAKSLKKAIEIVKGDNFVIPKGKYIKHSITVKGGL